MDKWKVRRTKKGELDGGMLYQMVNFGYLRDLTPLEDSLKIWRFMDLPKFLSILQSKKHSTLPEQTSWTIRLRGPEEIQVMRNYT